MASNKQKLELTWIGKENRPRLEPRILLEDPELSYHASHRVSDDDIFDNRLIFGDNLLALKALEAEFAGIVKCVYIDPPFNIGEALEYYDDGLEHSLWLSLMRERLQIIHQLLSKEGTLFVHIDDTELAYLVVLLDELFGRSNRIAVITFKQGAVSGHKSINPGVVTTSNFVVMYAKDKSSWKPNRVYVGLEKRDSRYNQFIENHEESFENWRFCTLTKAIGRQAGQPEKGLKKALGAQYEQTLTNFVMENGHRVVRLARPDYNAVSGEARSFIDRSRQDSSKVLRLQREAYSDMYFVGGERILFYEDKFKTIDGETVAGQPLTTIWDDLLSNEGAVNFPKGKKPEALIKRCLELSTVKGDLVLDSFAGSGTTGAVAQKMGRRWVMIEVRDHCNTHIVPRMTRVINGEDTSGVTSAMAWKGGGGFRYYRLAPSLLEKDAWDNWVISHEYNATMLSEALCKLEGFIYAPSDSVYWQHGQSTERDFIYVTTASLTHEQLRQLSDEVGPERSLLVVCSAFRGAAGGYANLTIKKIPNAVLSRCEWGHDDYSLKVENLPQAPIEPRQEPLFADVESSPK